MAAQIDKYLLGVFLNPAAVGIYNIALTAEQKAYSSVFTMSEVLFPAFSSISNESLELKADALMKASWILTVAAVCVLAPLIPLATDLISVWINADVAGQGAIVLRTLCVGGILGCATSATYFFLLGTGKTRIITVMAVATGVVTVIVSAIVLPRFGLKAAGWSGIAAMIVQMMFIFAILKKIFGSILTWSHITTSLHVPIAAGLSVAFLVSGIGRPPLTTWPSLILAYAIVFVLTLVTTLAVNALMPHGRDRNMFLMSMVRSLLPGRSSAGRI
jgi:O-antigen/teichoic acid export membrane protein